MVHRIFRIFEQTQFLYFRAGARRSQGGQTNTTTRWHYCSLCGVVCVRVAINPKSQVVRRGKKRWENVVHTAKMLPYEVEKAQKNPK